MIQAAIVEFLKGLLLSLLKMFITDKIINEKQSKVENVTRSDISTISPDNVLKRMSQ